MALDYVDTIDLEGEQWDIADTNLQNTYLETVYPIGVTYLQFPQQKAPTELFPQFTWEELNYNGAFFRASGGYASAFNSGTQSDMIKQHSITGGNHRHQIGSPSGGNSGNYPKGYYSTNDLTYTAYSGNLTLTYGTNSNIETRPINQTVRIWVRKA